MKHACIIVPKINGTKNIISIRRIKSINRIPAQAKTIMTVSRMEVIAQQSLFYKKNKEKSTILYQRTKQSLNERYVRYKIRLDKISFFVHETLPKLQICPLTKSPAPGKRKRASHSSTL